ncbi:MAG: murein biosynthesis integral membrane protein MurJ, partial [Halothiobacillaceae bacterium]
MILLAVPGTHAALAAATAFAAWLNAFWLYRALRRSAVYQPGRQWRRLALQAGGATLGMGALLFLLAPELAAWSAMHSSQRALWLAGLVLGAVTVYFALLAALGLRLRDLKREEATWS